MATKTATKYIEAIGRRKTASARVRLSPSKERSITINNKSLEDHFGTSALVHKVISVFGTNASDDKYEVSAHVKGGGISAQAEAVRHGIARALVKESEERRIPLKREGFLKRDPRSKERRKFGLRKARKSKQWSKR